MTAFSTLALALASTATLASAAPRQLQDAGAKVSRARRFQPRRSLPS